jgi:vancomycin permeability regulator SanA
MQKAEKRLLPRKLVRWGIALALVISLPRMITTLSTKPHIKTVEQVPQTQYGVVLAAETTPQGLPSAVLKDRIQRGVELYFAGKVSTLVMSGRSPEPAIMRDYAISLGVPEADIVLDNGGIRTYATCYNAATQLELSKAIFITQPFHLPRTIFLCRALGIDATGVAADHGSYWRGAWLVWNIRETLATLLAFQQLYISPPDTSEYITLYQEG